MQRFLQANRPLRQRKPRFWIAIAEAVVDASGALRPACQRPLIQGGFYCQTPIQAVAVLFKANQHVTVELRRLVCKPVTKSKNCRTFHTMPSAFVAFCTAPPAIEVLPIFSNRFAAWPEYIQVGFHAASLILIECLWRSLKQEAVELGLVTVTHRSLDSFWWPFIRNAKRLLPPSDEWRRRGR
ncbi:MAG: hypothetical protein ACI9IV_001983 [Paracoccaceae bacterium]|jgi:hypothetical protein